MLKCIVCHKSLSKIQKKYCSKKCCHHQFNTTRYHTYYKLRGEQRKKDLIALSGGKCQKCGYNKCIAALCFHHIAHNNKSFELNILTLMHYKWDKILEEHKKCQLLCMNCHFETHYYNGNKDFGRPKS